MEASSAFVLLRRVLETFPQFFEDVVLVCRLFVLSLAMSCESSVLELAPLCHSRVDPFTIKDHTQKGPFACPVHSGVGTAHGGTGSEMDIWHVRVGFLMTDANAHRTHKNRFENSFHERIIVIAGRVEADRRAKQIARLDGKDLAADKAKMVKQQSMGLLAAGGCVAHTGSSTSLGASKFRPLFSLCFRHPEIHFPRNSRVNEGVQN